LRHFFLGGKKENVIAYGRDQVRFIAAGAKYFEKLPDVIKNKIIAYALL